VLGSGGCQDNGNHEWSTALHSTAEHSMKVMHDAGPRASKQKSDMLAVTLE